MKMYTSYYARVSKAPLDALLIRVSNTAPKWFDKELVTLSKCVFPKWSDINAYKNGLIDYNMFSTAYRESIIREVDPDLIMAEIEELAETHGKDTVVLLCYERTGCHRTVLAHLIDNGCYCGEL
jgi:uncharacterized protein YeaO (DUF488 family)